MTHTRSEGQNVAWRLKEMAKDLSYLRRELPSLFASFQDSVESWCLGEGMAGDPDTLWHVLATGFETERLVLILTSPADPLAPALARAATSFPAMDRARPIEDPLLPLPHGALAALDTLGYPLLDRLAAHKTLDELCLTLGTPYALQAWRRAHPRTDPAFSYWARQKRFEIPRAPETAWTPLQTPSWQTKLSAPGVAVVQEALARILRGDKVPAAVNLRAILTTKATVYMDTRIWAALVVLGADPDILCAGKPSYDAEHAARYAWLWSKGATAHAELARQQMLHRRLEHAWSVERILAQDHGHIDPDVAFPVPQEVAA